MNQASVRPRVGGTDQDLQTPRGRRGRVTSDSQKGKKRAGPLNTKREDQSPIPQGTRAGSHTPYRGRRDAGTQNAVK